MQLRKMQEEGLSTGSTITSPNMGAAKAYPRAPTIFKHKRTKTGTTYGSRTGEGSSTANSMQDDKPESRQSLADVEHQMME